MSRIEGDLKERSTERAERESDVEVADGADRTLSSDESGEESALERLFADLTWNG